MMKLSKQPFATALAVLLACLVACVFSGAAAFAQVSDEEYAREFRKGYDALVAGKLDDGIASMKRCLEMRSHDATAAYNLSCAYSLKKETDPAVEWFDKSVAWGFAFGQADAVEFANKDKDLEHIRSDERFVAALERMKEQIASAEKYAAAPVVYVPAALESAETVGLLVVLHDNGETKDKAFAEGPWKQLADELGYALIVPSAKVPTDRESGFDPAKGMAWYAQLGEYEQNYWKYEKPVTDAVSAFRKQRKLDSARVHIVGVGGGAIPAFNIALSSPGLYKAVVLHRGAPNLRMAGAKAANAVKLGLKASILFPSQPVGEFAEMSAADYNALLDRIGPAVKSLGLECSLERFDADGEAAAVKAALAAMAPKPAAAESGR